MAASSARAPAILLAGHSLTYNTSNDRLVSPNGKYSLIAGAEGIYIVNNYLPSVKIWTRQESWSKRAELHLNNKYLAVNKTAIFSIRDSLFSAVLSAKEFKFLAMQDDGNLVLYGVYGTNKQYAFWNTGTTQLGQHTPPGEMYKIYETILKPVSGDNAPAAAAPSAPGLLFAKIARQMAGKTAASEEASPPEPGLLFVHEEDSAAAIAAAEQKVREAEARERELATAAAPPMTARQRREAFNATLLANIESQQAIIHSNIEVGTQKINEERQESERGAAAAAAAAKTLSPVEILQQKKLNREYETAKYEYSELKDHHDDALLKQKIAVAIEYAPPFSVEMFYLRKIMEEGNADGRVSEVYRQIAPYVSILPEASKCGNRLKQTLREYLSNAAAEAAVPLPEPFGILTRESTQLLHTHFSIAENQLQQIFQQTIGLLTDNDETDLVIELIMCSLQRTDYRQLIEHYRKANRGEVSHIPLLRPIAAAVAELSFLGGARPRRFTRRYMKNK